MSNSFRKRTARILSLVMALLFVMSHISIFAMAEVGYEKDGSSITLGSSLISQFTDSIKTNIENYFDAQQVYMLPETVKPSDEISVIITVDEKTLLEVYNEAGTKLDFGSFMLSSEAAGAREAILDKNNDIIELLNKSKIDYEIGQSYNTLLSGFEINIKAGDFEKVGKLLSSSATLIVGDVYEPLATTVVENEVDVYETGIFDSSSSKHQGDGVIVAVLDTGLDYTHTAFADSNFTTSNEAFTLETIAAIIAETAAARFTSGITANDVYVGSKVPFAYDYADKDSDVFPINSDHGTHVAGVIAGKDDTITGVAPNAQLAIMKVFSDFSTGAKTSWLIAALEDCVKLGVDVINMSLGSSCGFAREVDKQNINEIYDNIKAAGISLITAASNDNNATAGSEKNGSNPLTSNPDSGTVGSPSTYDASLSVSSVDGVKTPYMLFNDQIMYFNEASTSAAETKDFVDDLLKTVGNPESYDFTYVTIPGLGRSSDYMHEADYYKGKIVLVKRGVTTFEEKIRIALKEKGAAGVIIYNNVSGTISMSVGPNIGACCSISQDDGELLAAQTEGVIRISRKQEAGPFMSNFSSWGPTSDLQIKPEITGHGGEILSAVPGQDYDRLSGTSMACPNVAGATALVRQYVKEGYFGDLSPLEVTAVVNRLMMSTADIIYNKNDLPSSVRKQGAGLVNIAKATSSLAYLTTYDKDGNPMDKSKLELGDDKEKTGVYEMTFTINNFGSTELVYNVGGIILTEGVSPTYTSHGDTTVTMDGYLLSGAVVTVEAVKDGTAEGNTVKVGAKSNATVTVKVTLSEEDKKYMDDSFEHGMYVEGYITLDLQGEGGVNMNLPMLAFYGDWTEAPIFDEEYYDTHKDEINDGIDTEDKLMPDAYATRVIGGLYTDYISTLGTYYFVQNPTATKIAASKDHIAISNQQMEKEGDNYAISSIRSINAGFLRNVKELTVSIVEVSTGREIYNQTTYNQRKSFSQGNNVYASSIDVEFSTLEHNLKNNTQYEVTVTTYIDYGEKEEQNNARNTFTFPLFIDFEAPIVTDVEYRTEYDKTTQKTSLYADISVYDNHYAMGLQAGQIVPADPASGYAFSMETFGRYITPVYSAFNSTSVVTVELTDYVSALKNSAGLKYDEAGNSSIEYNNNSFIVTCYDYAMNVATYELTLPEEVMYMYFGEEQIKLSPNETLDLSKVLNIYPSDTWIEVLDFESDNKEVAAVVNQTIVAKKPGVAKITATGYNANGEKVTSTATITVLGETDEGYVGGYTEPSVNRFEITGYKTIKAYYSISNDEREIGVTGGVYDFSGTPALSMFPSESVELQYLLDSYSPDDTTVEFSVGKNEIASVDENGVITANKKGSTVVFVTVKFKDKSTLYSGRVNITVKDPFTTNSIYLMSYKGNGGEVIIPSDRGITTIYSYAFSNYEYVDKDLNAGDVIDEEDPYYIKQQYIGENTITKVVIPEGVTEIQAYAFAGLTALEEVVFPTTLKKIGMYAFAGCTSLKTLSTSEGGKVKSNSLDYVKFINKSAFENCALEEVSMNSVVAVGDYAFKGCKLNYLELPASSQSIGAYAFMDNKALTSVELKAAKVKIGSYAFYNCDILTDVEINASVVSSYAFYSCDALANVTLGKDVAVIGEFAFADTAVKAFDVDGRNKNLKTGSDGSMVYSEDGKTLVLVAPTYAGNANTVTLNGVETIGAGAFSGNKKIFKVVANGVKNIGAYAFAYCQNLESITADSLETVGNYAFSRTGLKAVPKLDGVKKIGDGAFSYTQIESIKVGSGVEVGKYAFAYNIKLADVTVGDNVKLGEGAFYCPVQLFTYETTGSLSLSYYDAYLYEVKDNTGKVVESYYYYTYDFTSGTYSVLKSLKIGENAEIGDYAFYGNGKLETVELGRGATIGKYSFFNNASLRSIDLSCVKSIGDYAFAGSTAYEFSVKDSAIESLAYEREWINGEVVIKNYRQTGFAPSLVSVDLSSCESLGKAVFANNKKLTSVKWNDKLTVVPEYTFSGCTSLLAFTLPETVTEIGKSAFYNSGLKEINLGVVDKLGEAAFTYTDLASVSLKEKATVGAYAFAYCYRLENVAGLDHVTEIGDYAFALTALKSLTLTDAEIVGDFAFAESDVTEVVFGSVLRELGENPFYGCAIESYAKTEDVVFNGITVGSEKVETYDVSETVKVIDGVLYQVVPEGYELVSYPADRDARDYTVIDGTVRISAKAFAGANLRNVMFPISLKALGDKAFYGCEELKTVVFASYNAPTLEEEYNTSYITADNLPFTGNMGTSVGLGISKYYMWNALSRYNNFYFGATFVDYIGHIKNELVMIYPANGQNYDTMILGQYFKTSVKGGNAPIDATLAVIEMIDSLPASITLAAKDAVVAAREAYNLLPSTEQQALVHNYMKLTNAESTITYLEMRDEPADTDEPVRPDDNNGGFAELVAEYWWVAVIIGVVAVAAVVIIVLVKKGSKKKTSAAIAPVEETPAEETPAEDSAENTESTENTEDQE